MYSNLKSVQILVAMLKKKNIRNIVISPGNSHNAIVRSIEEDGFFKTYNIVDERSAAFFATGLIQELNEPVAICCTSGTAAVNYMTGVTEAFRRKLPLIVITGDKNPYYLAQLEDQMIDQVNLFKTNTRYTNSLPIVKNEKDEWYCQRIINEAFLEMDHHGIGPVHINVPIEEGMLAINNDFTTVELPKVNLIERIDYKTSEVDIKNKFEYLKNKKVLILYGQDYNIPEEKINKLEKIFENYNCVISVDKLSNIHCKGSIETTRASLGAKISKTFAELVPNIVITIGGNVAWDGKFTLKGFKNQFESWLVTEEGKVQDYYKNLTTIFEMTMEEFLENMAKYEVDKSKTYYELWDNKTKQFNIPEFEYSNLYTVQKLMNNLPKNSELNLANSTTIRIAQYFDLDNSIKVYCNRGVNGIDGCMSTFIGQATASDKLNFLIIGDLTFFYDMNALWNRYVGKKVRIMLNNNSGAALFHFNQGLKNYPTLNENVAADHDANAKGWAESRGFKYLYSTSKEEFDKNLQEFLNPNSQKPIILEVFTKKEEDARLQHEFFDYNLSDSERLKRGLKNVIKKAIGR
mgnify:FL=1